MGQPQSHDSPAKQPELLNSDKEQPQPEDKGQLKSPHASIGQPEPPTIPTQQPDPLTTPKNHPEPLTTPTTQPNSLATPTNQLEPLAMLTKQDEPLTTPTKQPEPLTTPIEQSEPHVTLPSKENGAMDIPLITAVDVRAGTEADTEQEGKDLDNGSLAGLFSLPQLQARGTAPSSFGRRLLIEVASEGEEDGGSSHSEEDRITDGQNEDFHSKEVWLTEHGTSDERSTAVVGQPQHDLVLEEMERDHKNHTQRESTVQGSGEDDTDHTSREMKDQVLVFSSSPFVCVCVCVCVCVDAFDLRTCGYMYCPCVCFTTDPVLSKYSGFNLTGGSGGAGRGYQAATAGKDHAKWSQCRHIFPLLLIPLFTFGPYCHIGC